MTCNDNLVGGFFPADPDNLGRAEPAGPVQASMGIQNAGPSVTITSPANHSNYLPGGLLQVTALVNDPGSNDTIQSCWTDWGDGSRSPSSGPPGLCSDIHTYTSGGPRTLTVTVTDNDGGVGSDTIFIEAPLNAPPNGTASGGIGPEGSAIEVSGTASDPDGDPISTSWEAAPLLNTDPGAACTFADASSLTTTATCDDNGIYLLVLHLRDGVTADVTVTSTLTVPNATPTVTIIAPAAGTSVPAGAGLNFGAQISDAGTNDTHSCFINWGDDTESEGHVVDGICSSGHVYTTYGSHAVNAFVVDDDGESAGASVTITVTDDLLKVTGDGTIDGNTSFSLSARGSGVLNTSGQLQLRTGRNRFRRQHRRLHPPQQSQLGLLVRQRTFQRPGRLHVQGTVVDNSTGSGTNKPPDTISLLIRSSSGAVVFATNGPVPLRSGNIVVHG